VLELGLALGLVMLSATVFLSGLALILAGTMAAITVLYRLSPLLGYGVIAGVMALATKCVDPVMKLCWKGLAALWKPFLTYYRYEAHTLRPIKDDETNDRDAH